MKTIIAIVGAAGSGKDSLASRVSVILNANYILSYTTRPKREEEIDNPTHIHVDRLDFTANQIVAFTYYGGYKYCTIENQFEDLNVFVVDEIGLQQVKRNPNYNCIAVYINKPTKKPKVLDFTRKVRDNQRISLPLSYYDIILKNKGNVSDLLLEFMDKYNKFTNVNN